MRCAVVSESIPKQRRVWGTHFARDSSGSAVLEMKTMALCFFVVKSPVKRFLRLTFRGNATLIVNYEQPIEFIVPEMSG